MKKFKRVIASICAVMMIMSTFAATTVAATPKEQEQIEAISEADIAVANALPVILLHFYCIDDLIGFLFKILSVDVFYYGLSMFVMFFSKSAPITVMVLLLYDLINTFVSSTKVFLLYENFEILTLKMFLTNYFPLIIVAIIFIAVVFKDGKKSTN